MDTTAVRDDDGDVDTPKPPLLRITGVLNTMLLLLYLMGWLGPHYLKISGGMMNCSVVGFLWFYTRQWWAGTILFGSYCFPAMVFVIQAVYVPSISEILPGVYLGNHGAAFSSTILTKCRISHILDLSHSTRQRPSNFDNCTLVVKQVHVNDFLYSHGSLAMAMKECMAFMVETRKQPDAVLLIHCAAGQSRSAAFLLYYLLEHKMTNLQEAYAFLRNRRPVVDISSDHLGPLQRQYPGTISSIHSPTTRTDHTKSKLG
jgi:predicted protein tyrosine phosphatase